MKKITAVLSGQDTPTPNTRGDARGSELAAQRWLMSLGCE